MSRLTLLLAFVSLALFHTGCGGEAEKATTKVSHQGLEGIITTTKPTGEQRITAVKADANFTPGKAIVIRGRIGGSIQPFIAGRAAFLVADEEAVMACDAMPEDHCSTPWDFCCAEKTELAQATALVQITDEQGNAKTSSLLGVGDLKPGSFVVVNGVIHPQATSSNLIINAASIYHDTKRQVVPFQQ